MTAVFDGAFLSDVLAEAFPGVASTVDLELMPFQQRSRSNNVGLVTRETPMAVFDVLADQDGDIPDLNAITLEVIIESISRMTTITVPNGSILRDVTGSGANVTAAKVMFRWPSGVTTAPSEWRWALRETTFDVYLGGGLVTVTYEP